MSYIDGNDLVFYAGSDKQIYSGGFSVNSIMMKSGISPFTTLNNIQKWVAVDNQLKSLNEKMKSLRETRNALSGDITSYAEKNNLTNNTVNISDGKLKFVNTKVQTPLTLKFLEKSLGEVIRNEVQAKQIVEQIKDKRETKNVPEIKRFSNN